MPKLASDFLGKYGWFPRLASITLASIFCLGMTAEETTQVTLQDMRIAGRVLAFQDDRPSGAFTMAILYAASNPASRAEADTIGALLGEGLSVGSLVLHSLVIQQDRLSAAGQVDVVFATVGLDDTLLKMALIQRHVPCLTRHHVQVAQGSCTVAIRSAPSVSITLNSVNAALSGIRFATAFRMMVNEL